MPDKPSFGISVVMQNIDEFSANVENAPEIIHEALVKHVLWATPFMERQVKIQATNKRIKRRSGRYITGIRHKVFRDVPSGIVGTNVLYARQIELGGKLRAKKSKIGLAVPLRGAKTRAGVSKKPRQYDGFLVKRDDGTWFLFGKRTKKAKKIVPLFIFKDSVKQEGKLVFATAFDKNQKRLLTHAERRLAGALKKAFEKQGGE